MKKCENDTFFNEAVLGKGKLGANYGGSTWYIYDCSERLCANATKKIDLSQTP